MHLINGRVHTNQWLSLLCTASCIAKERRVRGKYKCYQVDMKTKGGKLKITIPDDILRPVKDNARDIVNFCGFIVRSLAPLDVDTWQEVVAAVGDQMMKQVKVMW